MGVFLYIIQYVIIWGKQKTVNTHSSTAKASSLHCDASTLTALVEEPVKMIVMEKASATESLQGTMSAAAVLMASSMQESSLSSSSMSEVKFESMSASMSSMTSETMVAMSSSTVMSSSSVMEVSATHSHMEGSTSQHK